MVYVDGGFLAQRLKERGRFEDCREAVSLACQVAEALQAVHTHSIIHRDLKPGNILLSVRSDRIHAVVASGPDESGHYEPLLSDFGLARASDEEEHLTSEGVVIGTPAYMAPEQADPRLGPVSPHSDLYSLGVVLYQMVTGRLPFTGTASQILAQVAHETPPSPSHFRPDVDPTLEAVLLKAMAHQPSARYADARQFADALQKWVARPESAKGVGDLEARPESAKGVPPNLRRWRLAVAGAVLLLAGIGGYLLVRSLGSTKPWFATWVTRGSDGFRGLETRGEVRQRVRGACRAPLNISLPRRFEAFTGSEAHCWPLT